LLDLQLQIM